MPRTRATKPKRRQAARRPQLSGLWIVGGVILLALAVTALLVFLNSRPVAAGEFVTVETKEWPQEDGTSLGPADAPVVVREFSDFQCPFCRQFDDQIKDRLIEEYVETGLVRFEYNHFIVIDGNVGGTESRRAAEASECAAEQGAFWDYNDMLFANQRGEGTGAFNNTRLKAFAEALGLDTAAFNACFDSRKYADKVTADEREARSLGVRGTPALFVNDQQVQNPLNYDIVKAAIDAALEATDE